MFSTREEDILYGGAGDPTPCGAVSMQALPPMPSACRNSTYCHLNPKRTNSAPSFFR